MKRSSALLVFLLPGVSAFGQTGSPDTYTLAVSYNWDKHLSPPNWTCFDSVFFQRHAGGEIYKQSNNYCDPATLYQYASYDLEYDTCGRLKTRIHDGPKTDTYEEQNVYDQHGELAVHTSTAFYNSSYIHRSKTVVAATYSNSLLQYKLERHTIKVGTTLSKTFLKVTNSFDSNGHISYSQFAKSSDSLNFAVDSTFSLTYNLQGQPVDIVKATSTSTVKYSGIFWENFCNGFTNTNGFNFTFPCRSCQPVMRELTSYTWDAGSNSFLTTSRYLSTVGTQNEKIYTKENYNSQSGQWTMYERETRFLNSNGRAVKVIYESSQKPTCSESFVYVSGNLSEKYTINASGDSIARVLYFPGFVTGVKEQTNDPALSVWPNPARNDLNVSYPFSRPGSIQIYDSQGLLLLDGTIDQSSTTINVSSLPRAIVFVVITGPQNTRITRKIVLGVD